MCEQCVRTGYEDMNRHQITMKVEYVCVHVSTHSDKCMNTIQVSFA